jgi:hypothetical protein
MYLKRKIRAWIGWRDARESESREYRSSTINGRPNVLRSSLWVESVKMDYGLKKCVN